MELRATTLQCGRRAVCRVSSATASTEWLGSRPGRDALGVQVTERYPDLCGGIRMKQLAGLKLRRLMSTAHSVSALPFKRPRWCGLRSRGYVRSARVSAVRSPGLPKRAASRPDPDGQPSAGPFLRCVTEWIGKRGANVVLQKSRAMSN